MLQWMYSIYRMDKRVQMFMHDWEKKCNTHEHTNTPKQTQQAQQTGAGLNILPH